MKQLYDVIIIGKGPAGISASLYTSRANIKTLVIGKESILSKSNMIDNYYGFKDGISGSELLKQGEEQTLRFGTDIVEDEVIALEYDFNGTYTVKTKEHLFNASTVLMATGSEKKKISIKNIDKFTGKGVHYCTTCDGYFYRDKKVAILGFNEYALNEAEEMKHFTKDVSILTNGNAETVDFNGLNINRKKIVSFEGDNYLNKVVYDDNSEEYFDGIFVAYGTASSVDFARKLGIVIKDGLIVVDKEQKTNLNGLFAAGDCTSEIKQIGVAVGQGTVAGLKIIEYIRKLRR